MLSPSDKCDILKLAHKLTFNSLLSFICFVLEPIKSDFNTFRGTNVHSSTWPSAFINMLE